jgi:hypothetical protein
VRVLGAGEEDSPDQMPFTAQAKQNLVLALREALSLDHDYIGTEHVLLRLVRENESVACRILLDFDVDPEKVRNAVILMLAASDFGPPGPHILAVEHGNRVTVEDAASETYTSALALARAFRGNGPRAIVVAGGRRGDLLQGVSIFIRPRSLRNPVNPPGWGACGRDRPCRGSGGAVAPRVVGRGVA